MYIVGLYVGMYVHVVCMYVCRCVSHTCRCLFNPFTHTVYMYECAKESRKASVCQYHACPSLSQMSYFLKGLACYTYFDEVFRMIDAVELIQLSFLSTATAIMIKEVTYTAGSRYIFVVWSTPKYLPFSYKLRTVCTLICGTEPYLNSEVSRYPTDVSMLTKNLHPGSSCKSTLTAIYNDASLDQGIQRNVSTKSLSK